MQASIGWVNGNNGDKINSVNLTYLEKVTCSKDRFNGEKETIDIIGIADGTY